MTSQQIMLTSHKDKKFDSQTLVISGHGFVKCTFTNCTLILTNSPVILNDCRFNNCNWRLEYDILWGNPNNRSMLRKLLDMMDGGEVKKFSSVMH